ncbi:hypothetical protein SAMN05216490_0275 [Mucilaginibacter mallensis]|uniref:Uncharacterized protein n=1 Tax=Mucilaginibacter mallensis TaxID=652787 RepID=A0A1H1NAA5_MUCMA|nr:hypothetical protein [Mucilaginibacter mallensis]SDR95912.1 hypothetical protein SAMN05216490_0275 [Mucilaginibacter mallensis]
MKYIINYVLFMAVCAVISPFFKNNVHSSSSHPFKDSHNMISSTTHTDYWGLRTNLSPTIMDDKNQTVEHNVFTSYWGTIILRGN